jgi:hypothetical protein
MRTQRREAVTSAKTGALSMAFQRPAKGHTATVMLFDELTCFVPLNPAEVNRLTNILSHAIARLKATGDFPEQEEYQNLLDNLQTAQFLLSPMNTRR